MTTSRAPQHHPRPSLPLIAATAALPAVVLSSLAIAQPAAAEPRARAVPATLAAAMRAQAKAEVATSLKAAVIPAASVPVTLPSALRPAQSAVPAQYTIARGDTISAIAGRYGLDTYAVLKLNNLQANTLIYPGQKIKLTGSTAAAPATSEPATSEPAASASVTSAQASVYVVKSGDTLSAIAARHGVGLSEVFKWNGLGMGSIIYPGQKVKVSGGSSTQAPSAPAAPAPAAPSTPATAPASSGSYTIKSGDTLSGIAARNGVRLSDVLSANRLTMSSIIYPGQKLVIPGASTISPASTTPAATQPAATTPLVPSTFLGFTYPAAVVSSANQNKALLNASPVPTREQMKSIVADTARRMGVDASLALAFAYQESGFNQRAVSPANAIGTMQVIPSSGEWASELVGRKLNLLDPYDNATAGVAIIRQLVRTSSDLDNAIAGYYQGQYSVSQNGMYDDTKAYVAAINANRTLFS
ncbi:Soluble lytic murein transglycosylase and related regulatory proteins (some contain LysM/invasin domains) [Arthrobacter sp. ok909]|uniref:lytic transglycosylase domain-containing protein n=1 Tax=Arthrobacter sp. ok909 TaxID=1761746 RepID=UPI00087FBAFB|nr:lytic transglycosylase domain-containing protein [Arthrobacter sp. ok909]SDP66958.1 Soluble lytic murein transglycosylase and related regulatory proteins (some contain LysM/invasin domains) [Arthrobacter sp. ok909]